MAPSASAPTTCLGVEPNEARVIAGEAANERPARQVRVVALFERAHLARRELELLRDRIDRQAGGLARRREQRARRGRPAVAGLRARRDVVLGHSQVPVAMDFASAVSG